MFIFVNSLELRPIKGRQSAGAPATCLSKVGHLVGCLRLIKCAPGGDFANSGRATRDDNRLPSHKPLFSNTYGGASFTGSVVR